MADLITDASTGRTSKNELMELKALIKELFDAFKRVEEETGEAYISQGTYLGVKFE